MSQFPIVTPYAIDSEGCENDVSYDTQTRILGEYDKTTLKLFGALTAAYNYFREELFDANLPPVILTLNQHNRSMGYYRPHAWLNGCKRTIPEINISPAILRLGLETIWSTLVHEMCHHYQEVFGTPGRGGYHNREFARIMFDVGLICSETGKVGGRQVGQNMSDYPDPNGRFLRVLKTMPEEFVLPFLPNTMATSVTQPTTSDKNKTKYRCAACSYTVWGKPNLHLLCIDCKSELQ